MNHNEVFQISTNILTFRDLCVGYAQREVLSEINLTVRRGEILSLIGPNGAGKTTLLRTICGQLLPLRGEIIVSEGKEQAKWKPDQEAGYLSMDAQESSLSSMSAREIARKMAVVLTQQVRPEHMTCLEVVEAGRYPHTGAMGRLRQEDHEAVERAMSRMHVEELAGRDFDAISDGQRQRVMIARAIAQTTPILLLDEPTSYLDLRYKEELIDVLKELAREGTTIIMSLHEVELALEVSDRLLCVQEGERPICGTPEEVLCSRVLQQLFELPDAVYDKHFGHCNGPMAYTMTSEEPDSSPVSEDIRTENMSSKDKEAAQPKTNASQLFTNRECPYYPCHRTENEEEKEHFNCLFCYCPLYAMGEKCGGNFRITDKGIKDCSLCMFPHRPENYDALIGKIRDWNRGKGSGNMIGDCGNHTQANRCSDTKDDMPGEVQPEERPKKQPEQRPELSAKLQAVIEAITPSDKALQKTILADVDALAVPPGGLGKLGGIVAQLGAITGKRRPRIRRKRIVVLCADNGVAEEGVAGTPVEVTAQQAVNIARGRSGMSSIATAMGCEVQVVDVGIATPYKEASESGVSSECAGTDMLFKEDSKFGESKGFPLRKGQKALSADGTADQEKINTHLYTASAVRNCKIRPGTANLAKEPAMNRGEVLKAILVGVQLAREAAQDGVDLLGVGEMGVGNTTTSAAVLAALTGEKAENVTGRGAGLTDAAYGHKVEVIRRALAMHFPRQPLRDERTASSAEKMAAECSAMKMDADPVTVLSRVGGLDLAAMCGVFLGCAKYRIPVVVDGFISAVAALCAARLNVNCRDYLFPSHRPTEQGFDIAMRELGMDPFLHLDMHLGEGSGCPFAFGVIEAACTVLADTASFAEAGIDDGYLKNMPPAGYAEK